jgi:hypothetical protein
VALGGLPCISVNGILWEEKKKCAKIVVVHSGSGEQRGSLFDVLAM